MIKYILIFLLPSLFAFQLLNAQGLTNIPDNNFEQALIDLGIDSDGTVNGEVLTDDINTITDLNLLNYNIEDLTGIENFDSLKTLNCSNNRLNSIDLSNNVKLINLDCSANLLDSLNLSSNTSLENLYCQNNLITVFLMCLPTHC